MPPTKDRSACLPAIPTVTATADAPAQGGLAPPARRLVQPLAAASVVLRAGGRPGGGVPVPDPAQAAGRSARGGDSDLDPGTAGRSPIPYVHEDAERLLNLASVKPHGSLGLQHASSLATLGGQLGKLGLARPDGLLLYLGAHGLAVDDQAFLVCSNFVGPSNPERGRYPLREVLSQVADCPAAFRLVVLNGGRLDYDPRLGLVAAEFPRAVERELRGLPAQELWVLLPGGLLERAAVVHPHRQSVFGLAIAEALEGRADLWPKDGEVSVSELYTYVRHRCSSWFAPDSGCGQTPLLMKAHVGLVPGVGAGHGADRQILVRVPRPLRPRRPNHRLPRRPRPTRSRRRSGRPGTRSRPHGRPLWRGRCRPRGPRRSPPRPAPIEPAAPPDREPAASRAGAGPATAAGAKPSAGGDRRYEAAEHACRAAAGPGRHARPHPPRRPPPRPSHLARRPVRRRTINRARS